GCTAERVGGTLTAGVGSPFSSMDPAIVLGTGQVGGDFMSAFYDTLMRYDATTQDFEPNVAESLEPNDDFTEWTLTLRPDVTFGNGDPLTTADVAFSIERLKTSRVRAAGMAQNIVGITIVDDLTMTFDVGDPWGGFPYVLAAEPGWVTNQRLVEERGDAFGTNPAGAGVGPFEFQRFAEGEEIVLTAKDDYWGGPVCIEELRFVNIPGDDARYEAFANGEMDTTFLSDVHGVTEAEEAGLLGFSVDVGALGYVLADQGITGRGPTPFQDVRVREAMQLAIDYDLINQRLYDGLSVTDSALVPVSSPLYHGVEGPPFDQDRARQLVEETGADGTWDGTFTFLHGPTPENSEQAVLLEAMWEAVGMTVTLETVPSVGQRVILERNFQVATNGFAIVDPAPWSTLNGLATGSQRQRTGYSNADMDAALTRLRAASTIEETREALADMQEVWNETFPVIVVDHSRWAIAVAEGVHGMRYGPDSTPYFHQAWIES
ncbi:MAG: ABC transporter substrate-binding protein, partial [Acidimicrobiales bacterium]